MWGMNPELHHGQVVGKISYINKNLEILDSQNQTNISEDYKEIIAIKSKYKSFEKMLEASKSGQLPDFDYLSKVSLILQEMVRLQRQIEPFQMTLEVKNAVYAAFKKKSDLWSSAYHTHLDRFEKLVNALTYAQPPKKLFLQAYIEKLKHHFAKNGFEGIACVEALLKKASNTLDLSVSNLERQIPIFLEFMAEQKDETPFAGILPSEIQQALAGVLIDNFESQLSSKTLQEILSRLKNPGMLTQPFLQSIDKIIEIDKQLKQMPEIRLNSYSLRAEEIEFIFAEKVQKSTLGEALDHTIQERDIRLLIKAFPQAADGIRRCVSLLEGKGYSWAKIRQHTDFQYAIIAAQVQHDCKKMDGTAKRAATQLCENMREKMRGSEYLDANSNLQKVYELIQHRIQDILTEIPQQKEKLQALGMEYLTFKEIDAIFSDYFSELAADGDEKEALDLDAMKYDSNISPNPETQATKVFYEAIHAAKMKYFYSNGDMKRVQKISAENVQGFFSECCKAGEQAASKLAQNRSFLIKVRDVLKVIANWLIHKLSFGKSGQFFKPQKTAVGDMLQELDNLQSKLNDILEHLKPAEEPMGQRI